MMAQFTAWWSLLLGQLAVWWPWLIAIAAGIAALFFAWWVWWRLPKRQVNRLRLTIRDPKARADVEDNFRKTIGQLLLAAAALVGAGLAYLQFTEQQRNTLKQFETQQDTSGKQFEEQQKASRDLLISNQVAKGFELLGNKDKEPMQRLGGIYALEGVMNTSEQYHQPVLEALCAFVRDNTRAKKGEEPPTTDIQAALTVIGRRAPIGKPVRSMRQAVIGAPYLVGAHIPKANLIEANLSNAFLNEAYLSGARLNETNLSGARLSGARLNEADLSGANLSSANLSLTMLIDASLNNTNLNNANLNGTHLNGASLNGADLRGARNIFQTQLDKACGTDVKLDPGLTIKPCPPQ